MVDRIPQDPRSEVILKYVGPHYDAIRQLLLSIGFSLRASHLVSRGLPDSHTWRTDPSLGLANPWGARRSWANLASSARATRARARAEKKPKMNDFQETVMVGSYIAPPNTPYSVSKTSNISIFCISHAKAVLSFSRYAHCPTLYTSPTTRRSHTTHCIFQTPAIFQQHASAHWSNPFHASSWRR